MADLCQARAQNLRGWHPETLTPLDFLALRAQLIATLEREAEMTRAYAAAVRPGAGNE